VKGALVSAQVGDPSAGDPRDKVVIEAASPTNENGWFKILVRPGTYNVVAYKDTYAFDFECGVHVEAGETIVLGDFQLNDLESANGPDYGFVEGDVVVAGGGSAAISFRIPGCAGEIEVKAVGIDSGGSYKEILPVGTYEVLAWSEGKDTELHPGVEVESASSTFVDIDM
jgi:hypothetical protein